MTRGTSETVEMRWPRARRREGTEEAARAEVVAKRLGLLVEMENGCAGEVLLAQIDLLMPLSPDFGGCEHAA
jgi:hypothetical protein